MTLKVLELFSDIIVTKDILKYAYDNSSVRMYEDLKKIYNKQNNINEPT